MKKLGRQCYLGYLLLIMLISVFTACTSGSKKTDKIATVDPIKPLSVINIEEDAKIPKEKDPRVLAIYYVVPIDVEPEDSYWASKMLVLYRSGEFGRMWLNLERRSEKSVAVIAYFDEVVQYGNWKVKGGSLLLKTLNCRCIHCEEDLERGNLRNPTPFTETWALKSSVIGREGSMFANSRSNYMLFDDTGFDVTNYQDMINEPLKLKNYSGDRYCREGDLKGF